MNSDIEQGIGIEQMEVQDSCVKQVEEQDAGVKQVQEQARGQDLAVERVIPPIRFRRRVRNQITLGEEIL